MAGPVKGLARQAPFASRLAKPAAPATAGPVILFSAGGMRFAVEAVEVAEIRDVAERGAIHGLKGTEAIDFAQRVGLGAGRLEHFVVLKPGNCSLGVTAVERMTTLPRVVPLPGLYRGAERQWYRGLLLLENDVIPLVRTEYWRQAMQRPERHGNESADGRSAEPLSP
jgi:hypothetical protein